MHAAMNNTNRGNEDASWAEFVTRLRSDPERPFAEHRNYFLQLAAARKPEDGPLPVWQPDAAMIRASNLGQLMQELGLENYPGLHAWTVANREAFWLRVIERLQIVFARKPERGPDLGAGVRNPRWLPGAQLNIAESCFGADADKPAIVFGDEHSERLTTITYGELQKLTSRVANGLREHGFGIGDAIALYMPMTIECVAAYLGIVRAGCRVVSIADSFSPEEVRKRLQIAQAKAIITVDAYNRAGRTVALYDKVQQAAAPCSIVIPGHADSAPTRVDLRAGDVHWQDFLSENETFDAVIGEPERLTNILFSSGTTGTPKAIPWTHLTPIKSGMDGHFHQDIHSRDVVCWPTNIGWMMGPWLIYATFLNGATMALFEGTPVSQRFIRFVSASKVTILGVVPSIVRGWRARRAVKWQEWDKIRLFSSTGEPSNREDYLWLMSRTGYRAPVIEYLGGTEIGGGHLAGTVAQPASPAVFTTPALGIDFVILDEDGQPVPEGGMGELFLIPPAIGLSQTLLNKDHEAVYYADCPAGPGGEVLRRHGDQIARLPGGYYRARGRADDAMNLGGIKVSSLELEHVAEEHAAVYECAAIAVQPGGEGREMLVLFVTLKKPSAKPKLKSELRKLIAEKLNPLFKVHDLVIVEQLPRTASNKLMRRKLRAEYTAKLK